MNPDLKKLIDGCFYSFPDFKGMGSESTVNKGKNFKANTKAHDSVNCSKICKKIESYMKRIEYDSKKLKAINVTNSNGVRVYTCPVCPFVGRSHGFVNAHVSRLHTKRSPFLCTVKGCYYSTWNIECFRRHKRNKHENG